MKIKELYAVNFRNYAECRLQLSSMINVFYGANAQGKTNLLEAIFYSSFGVSHRTSQEEEMLLLGAQSMAVGVDYACSGGSHQVKLKKYRQQERWKKEILLDGSKVRPKEHYGALNAVMFSPEDLLLVKGEPALRRRFLDMQISQTDPVYYDLLLKYNRVLLQRNRLLKELRDEGGSEAQLQPWNEEFIRLASVLASRRLQALTRLEKIADNIYSSLTGNREQLNVRYELKGNSGQLLYPEDASMAVPDFYRRLLAERLRIDILRGSTGIGPHRDDLQLLLNGVSLRAFGSQGQQRSAALALKLSQLEYVYREIGEYPVLLLDDVMSELDSSRRRSLLLFIDGRVQTFITVNDRELLPQLPGCSYFRIEQGTVNEVKNEE